MKNPKNYVEVSSISFLFFSLLTFIIGLISFISLGPQQIKFCNLLSDTPEGSYELLGGKLFQIDVDIILIIKIICLSAVILNYFIYAIEAFESLDRFIYLITNPSNSRSR